MHYSPWGGTMISHFYWIRMLWTWMLLNRQHDVTTITDVPFLGQETWLFSSLAYSRSDFEFRGQSESNLYICNTEHSLSLWQRKDGSIKQAVLLYLFAAQLDTINNLSMHPRAAHYSRVVSQPHFVSTAQNDTRYSLQQIRHWRKHADL
jgi:hypothetical protein